MKENSEKLGVIRCAGAFKICGQRHWAVKAASRVVVSPSGLVRVSCGAGLEAAAADGKSGATGGGCGKRRDSSDAERNAGEFDYGEAGGGEGEDSLAILVDGEKGAVQTVDVGESVARGSGKKKRRRRMPLWAWKR